MASLNDLVRQRNSLNNITYGSTRKEFTNEFQRQDKKYKRYQDKMIQNLERKSKMFRETFTNNVNPTNVGQQSQSTLDQTKITDDQINQLNQLQLQYNEKIQELANLKTQNTDMINNFYYRNNNQTYNGKNVHFDETGDVGYVTKNGLFKLYEKADMIKKTAGKNGCPPHSEVVKVKNSGYNKSMTPGTLLNTSPQIMIGTPMISGQSCGYEGENVYVNTMINNPTSSYVGCYNDKAPAQTISIVPVMNSSNTVNGFVASASSTYQNNNSFAGPWCAFDNNINTFWHTNNETDTTGVHLYNNSTGVYEGTYTSTFVNPSVSMTPTTVGGEILMIACPNDYVLTSYDLTGRQDCCGSPNPRDPNSWYILGLNANDNNWYVIDTQTDIHFDNGKKSFSIANPQAFRSYGILVTVAGDSQVNSNRTCVQIASWNLFTTTDYDTSSSSVRAMTPSIGNGVMTFEDCQQYAIQNAYTYFGLQNMKGDGTGQCMVSNDVTKSKMYGDASTKKNSIPLWSSSNTYGSGVSVTLQSNGQLSVASADGTSLWASTADPSCTVSYTNTPNMTASGNDFGTWTGKSVEDCEDVCNSIEGCYGFAFDMQDNTCQPKSKFENQSASDTSTLYTRFTPANTCVYLLSLQNDGNLCVSKGTDATNPLSIVWTAGTKGKQKNVNPDWVATKGKNGRSFLKVGETLNAGEWIGSNNGSCMLIMQTDGNLVLYTSVTFGGCANVSGDKLAGVENINAMYVLDQTGSPSNLGRLGYIGVDDGLYSYPSDMLGFSGNEYTYVKGKNATQNDLGTEPANASTVGDCQNICTGDPNCAGFVFDNVNNLCLPKNTNMYPYGSNSSLLDDSSYDTYLRKPDVVNPPDNISKVINNIDSIQYENYPKSGVLDANFTTGNGFANTVTQGQIDQLEQEINLIASQIEQATALLKSKNLSASQRIQVNYMEMQYQNSEIDDLDKKIKKNLNQGIGLFNMQEILNDTNVKMFQENYSYILWGIFAVTLVLFTLHQIRKQK